MEILANSLIKELMDRGQIVLEPGPEDRQLQPASIDLRLGKVYKSRHVRGFGTSYLEELKPVNGEYVLKEREPYAFSTLERLKMCNEIDLVLIAPRSGLGRALVSLLPCGNGGLFYVTPEYDDNICGSICSYHFPVKIKQGERIAQAVFLEYDETPVGVRKLHAEKFLMPKKIEGV